jgi:hypothetical protein
MSKVICAKAEICPEPGCGGKEPHWYDENECGHCPKDKNAKCVEVSQVKVVLDAKALEYLMKQGGEEFRIEIQQAALNAAAKHLLTAVTPDLLLKEVKELAYKMVINEIGRLQSETVGWRSDSKLILKPEYKEKLQSIAKDLVRDEVKAAVDGIYKPEEVKKQALERLEQAIKVIDYHVDQAVAIKLNDEVKKLIERKVAEAVKGIQIK